MGLIYRGIEYRQGSRIVATIKGEKVEGKLQMEYDCFFICHNNQEHSGRSAHDKLGYMYSWAFHRLSDGTITDEVRIISIEDSGALKEKFLISEKLLGFFNSKNINIGDLESQLIFTDYNKFDISENKGMVKLTSTKDRVVEFKLGRFLNSYIKQCVDAKRPVINTQGIIINVDNKFVEQTHNDYLVYQSGDYIKVEYLKGKELLEGYKRDNYFLSQSTLGGSCMTDKISFLDVYVNNPDKVQMIAVKIFDKVVGRALLWETDCGKKLMDKFYICEEWVINKLDAIRKENNYLNWIDYNCSADKILQTTLVVENISQWPYLDTFQFCKLNGTKALFYTYPPKGYTMRFRSTSGNYEDFNMS
jgi:hypothetical protein